MAIGKSKTRSNYSLQLLATSPHEKTAFQIVNLVDAWTADFPNHPWIGDAYADTLRRGLNGLGLFDADGNPFLPRGIRAGAAVDLLRRGTPIDDVLARGRWAGFSTANRAYLRELDALMAEAQIPEASLAAQVMRMTDLSGRILFRVRRVVSCTRFSPSCTLPSPP